MLEPLKFVPSNKWCILRPYQLKNKENYLVDKLTGLFKVKDITFLGEPDYNPEDYRECLPYQINSKTELDNLEEIIYHMDGFKTFSSKAIDCKTIFITTGDGYWRGCLLESDLYDSYEEAMVAFKKTTTYREIRKHILNFEKNREFLLSLVNIG